MTLHMMSQAFVEQIRQQLSADDFAAFRQDSASFMRGDIDAAALHRRVTQLNVAAAVPELAALCPDAGDVALLSVLSLAHMLTAHTLMP